MRSKARKPRTRRIPPPKVKTKVGVKSPEVGVWAEEVAVVGVAVAVAVGVEVTVAVGVGVLVT